MKHNLLLLIIVLSFSVACKKEDSIRGSHGPLLEKFVVESEPLDSQTPDTIEKIELSSKAQSLFYHSNTRIYFISSDSNINENSANGIQYNCQANINNNQATYYELQAGGMFLKLTHQGVDEIYERQQDIITTTETIRGRWVQVDEDSKKKIEKVLLIGKTRFYLTVNCTYLPGN